VEIPFSYFNADLIRRRVTCCGVAAGRNQFGRKIVREDAVLQVRRRVAATRRLDTGCIHSAVDRLGERDLRHLHRAATHRHLDVYVVARPCQPGYTVMMVA
jgi:hypothetical protein